MQLHVHVLDDMCVWLWQRLHLYCCQGSIAVWIDANHQWREIMFGRQMPSCEACIVCQQDSLAQKVIS